MSEPGDPGEPGLDCSGTVLAPASRAQRLDFGCAMSASVAAHEVVNLAGSNSEGRKFAKLPLCTRLFGQDCAVEMMPLELSGGASRHMCRPQLHHGLSIR